MFVGVIVCMLVPGLMLVKFKKLPMSLLTAGKCLKNKCHNCLNKNSPWQSLLMANASSFLLWLPDSHEKAFFFLILAPFRHG